MANSKKAEVPVRIGGKVLVLRFGNNAIAEIEDHFDGSNIAEVTKALASGLSISKVRTLLYYGLKKKQPTLSMEDIGDLMDEDDFEEGLKEYAKAINRALAFYFTGEEPKEEVEAEVEMEAETADPLPVEEAGTSPGIGAS